MYYGEEPVQDILPYRILDRRTHVARKEYMCGWCGLKIAPGEKYEYEVIIIDGEFHTYKSHFGDGACLDMLERDWS